MHRVGRHANRDPASRPCLERNSSSSVPLDDREDRRTGERVASRARDLSGLPELPECPLLDLAYALGADPQPLGDLRESLRIVAVEPEARGKDVPLSIGEADEERA